MKLKKDSFVSVNEPSNQDLSKTKVSAMVEPQRTKKSTSSVGVSAPSRSLEDVTNPDRQTSPIFVRSKEPSEDVITYEEHGYSVPSKECGDISATSTTVDASGMSEDKQVVPTELSQDSGNISAAQTSVDRTAQSFRSEDFDSSGVTTSIEAPDYQNVSKSPPALPPKPSTKRRVRIVEPEKY